MFYFINFGVWEIRLAVCDLTVNLCVTDIILSDKIHYVFLGAWMLGGKKVIINTRVRIANLRIQRIFVSNAHSKLRTSSPLSYLRFSFFSSSIKICLE